ncbi:MAG TPA: histidine--tRNA ligase [bacterium]|nr:histidine--tRNA ligase [bacterium]
MSTPPQPAKGTRDFLPTEVRKRYFLLDVIQDVFEAYGFEPLETPAFENIATLMAKGGGENEKLMFKILKRGEGEASGQADLALRFDHTVPLARVVATHLNDLAIPFKAYQLGPVWRAERPQRGRFREFVQCDIDIVGGQAPYAEAEILAAFHDILQDLQLADARIVVNHRKVLTGLFEDSGIPADVWTQATIILDKLDKVGPEVVGEQLAALGISPDRIEGLFGRIEAYNAAFATAMEQPEVFNIQFQFASPAGQAGLEELAHLWTLLAAQQLNLGMFIADAKLARGLDYYTGPVFEIQMMGETPLGSIGGGGRYDGLVGSFAKQDLPAVGFSIGFERLYEILDLLKLYPEDTAYSSDVLVAVFSEETVFDNLSLAQEIRDAGWRVETYPAPGNLGKQFKYADKKGVLYVVVQGPEEVAGDSVKVKDLKSGIEHAVPYEELLDWFQEQLTPPVPQNGGQIKRKTPRKKGPGSQQEP